MRTPNTTRILAASIALALAAPAAASAASRHAAGLIGPMHAYGRVAHHHVKHARHQAITPAAPRTNPVLGVGGAIPNDCADSSAQVARIILYWYEPLTDMLPCAQNATDAGMRLIVSIQYAGSQAQILARIQAALAVYSPLHPWAISIGNEQELDAYQGGQTAAQYSETWKAAEPLMASEDPQAIRVAGEISPWGLSWLQQAAADGLPGAQAYAAHIYPDSGSPWAKNPAPFVQLASQYGVQAWATEGMCGPSAWAKYGCTPASTLSTAGFAVGIDWMYDVAHEPSR